MTTTGTAPSVVHAPLSDRTVVAYQALDRVLDLLDWPGSLTDTQRTLHRRVQASLATAQADLDRLQLSLRTGDRS